MSTSWPELRNPVMMVRWTARVLALALLVFWGSFFTEHAVEWFARPGPWPPPAVIGLSAAHLILLAGLALAWKWELAGSILILASGLAFFAPVAGRRSCSCTAGGGRGRRERV